MTSAQPTSDPGSSRHSSWASAGRGRPPAHPARKRLGLAVGMVAFGSFLPWVHTAVTNVTGAGGPGQWTFAAAMLGLGAALLPFRRLGGVQATIMAGVCLVLPVWQVWHLLALVGTEGWLPGPGLVLVFGGGVLAGTCAWTLFTQPAPADAAGR